MKRKVFVSRLACAGALAALAVAGPFAAQTALAAGAEVKVAKTPLGDVLVGPNGLTLYMFTKDVNGESTCYDQCATAWPPLLTDDKPVAGKGVNVDLLGTTTRKDGKLQVTYNGLPLYYWFQDKKAGDVRGQDVGKVWYVVASDGSVNKQVMARVQMAKSPIGNVLVGPNGRTLYMFKNDKKNESACYDKCAENWPPLLTDVKPLADTGVNARLLGTAARTDGKLQVTYNGMPLYYWVNDKAAGDLLGQDVGKVWYVVAPNGRVITRAAPLGAKVSIGKTGLGDILVGPSGLTLYMFKNDKPGESACYDKCASNWPPLLTLVRPVAGDSVKVDLLGTITRKDGKLQVTYNGLPLYYFAQDKAAGDTKGQDVGEVWYAVSAAGEIVEGAMEKAAETAGAKVSLGKTGLGDILVGPNGLTLYLFTQDAKGESTCYDACAQAWPPLLTEGNPVAGDGAKADLLGTTTRKDGKLQVTYNGMPLYYWAADKAPGDTTGQNVGSVWFVVNAAGEAVK
jgi:predicted lipoprotein with Yx(FWY)xxD motif